METFVEVEWKFRVADLTVLQHLRRLRKIGPFDAGKYVTQMVFDTYYDTPAYTLVDAGYACRFRQHDETAVIQLKTLSPAQDTVHRRAELQASTDRPDWPQAWAPGPARDAAIDAVKDQMLAPIFHVDQVRHVAPLLQDGREVAQISLDEVRWLVGELAFEAYELEIEVSDRDSEAAVAAAVLELVQELNLEPEPDSKFQRGLKWALPEPSGDEPSAAPGEPRKPRKRSGSPFRPDEPATAMLHRIIAAQSGKLRNEYSGVVKGEQPEAVHDARVAIRRMRSALYFFSPWLSGKPARKLRRDLRDAGRILGAVRDLDVSITFVHEHAPAVAPAAEAPLRRYLDAERQRARADLVDFLKGPTFKQLRKSLAGFSRTRPEPRPRLGEILPTLIRQAANEMRLFEGTLVGGCPVEHLHALRIAAKHLRYLLEFTRFGTHPEGDSLIALVTDIQEELGQVHDAHFSSLLAFELLRNPKLSLPPQERSALLEYGLALGRYRDERAAQFLTPSPPPPWSVWLEPATQAQLEVVAAMLEGSSPSA